MLRRANVLVDRARERIRLAAERDLHVWSGEREDGSAVLVHDEEPDLHDDELEPLEDEPEPLDEEAPPPDDEQIAGGDGRPPLGSPEPGAPDVDVSAGVSAPPQGGRQASAHRRGSRAPRESRSRLRDADGDSVPTGLRIAAAWSWRGIPLGALPFPLLPGVGPLLGIVVPLPLGPLLPPPLHPRPAGG